MVRRALLRSLTLERFCDMKAIILAVIIWSNGATDSYVMESAEACVSLTSRIALMVYSANCYDAEAPSAYLSAPMIESAPADYFPPMP